MINGHLLETLVRGLSLHGSARAMAVRRLKELLPRVGPDDAPLFRSDITEALLGDLIGPDREFTLIIIGAMEHVGGEEAFESIGRLRFWTSDRLVRAAAREVLPALGQRAKRLRLGSRLLRPTSAPVAETLVRPAGCGSEPRELLVRPVHREE